MRINMIESSYCKKNYNEMTIKNKNVKKWNSLDLENTTWVEDKFSSVSSMIGRDWDWENSGEIESSGYLSALNDEEGDADRVEGLGIKILR